MPHTDDSMAALHSGHIPERPHNIGRKRMNIFINDPPLKAQSFLMDIEKNPPLRENACRTLSSSRVQDHMKLLFRTTESLCLP